MSPTTTGLFIAGGVLLLVVIGCAVGMAYWSPEASSSLAELHSSSARKKRLVLGYAPWCPKCKTVLPVFQRLQAKHGSGRVLLKNGDVPADKPWFAKNRLTKIPVMAVVDAKGMIVATHRALSEASIVAFAKQHGVF